MASPQGEGIYIRYFVLIDTLIRIAEQCYLHAFRRKVFHAPKGYFMLPQAVFHADRRSVFHLQQLGCPEQKI